MTNKNPMTFTQEDSIKGGKTTGPQKRGYFMERLAEEVFKSEEVFTEWVNDNYTEAVKELGKLQPKALSITGDEDNPIHTKVTVHHVRANSGTTGKDS